MKVLLTGGLGYIGSHTCVQLIEAGHDAVIIDNLSNAKPGVLDRIEKITNKRPASYEGDILDPKLLQKIFSENKIDAVIHFAGLKAVGESVEKPLAYYENNVSGSVCLFKAMEEAKVRNIVFSSSCTVYGDPKSVPISESAPSGIATNPYGYSKCMIEQILKDIFKAIPAWNIRLLRYFNPIGAHISGLIGEEPNGIPNNLMPYITQVAIGKRPFLNVYGNDYNTHDGTGIRDYIHVVDLADGHVCALERMSEKPGLEIYNLGTGTGCSVLDMVKAFEKANNIKIPYKIAPRRAGDIAKTFADPSKANKDLHWTAKRSLEDMCADSWRWQQYISGTASK